ncbi:putative HAD-hydrolase YfnB [compost metagenome]
MSLLGIEASEGLMVGDNPLTDIKGANSVGMRTIWMNHDGLRSRGDDIPTYEITNLLELPELIKHMK